MKIPVVILDTELAEVEESGAGTGKPHTARLVLNAVNGFFVVPIEVKENRDSSRMTFSR